MRVLVAVGSRHGSTLDIGERVGRELRDAGLVADVQAVDEVRSLAFYGAVVLGSAVYMGRWLPEVRRFIDRFQAPLAVLPVWLFSSGPLGTAPGVEEELTDSRDTQSKLVVQGHRVFAGKLDPHQLGLGERLIAKAVQAPAGDYRDWVTIEAWARSIAVVLQDGAERAKIKRVLRHPAYEEQVL